MIDPVTAPEEKDVDARHNEKMRRKLAVRERIMNSKTIEKGLIIIHTGKGKGKSTAAFGMALRMLGHGQRVGVVQFVKGRRATGERKALEAFGDQITVRVMGEGFTWETQDRQRDIQAARKAWEVAQEMILDPGFALVLLDEINITLRYHYLDAADVAGWLEKNKPDRTHVVLTGRNAPNELLAIADLVTEMTMIKHPFRSGVRPQPGIEF